MTLAKLNFEIDINKCGCRVTMYAKKSYLYKIQNSLTISERNRQILTIENRSLIRSNFGKTI